MFRDPEATIQWNPLIWPILGVIAIGLLQLFVGVTPYRYFTQLELLRFGAYLILFFLSVQAFRSRSDLKKLAWFLILLCFGVSLFGIAQHFTSEGPIYWVRPLRAGGDPFGPYVNRNHFAGFVELTLPIALAMLVFRGIQRDVYPLVGLLAIVPAGALILSGSRGGIVSFAFEIAVLWLLARTRTSPDRPRFVGIAIVAFAAVALIVWLGAAKALERFSSLHIGEVTMSRRVSMIRGAAHIFKDHPIDGVGLGALVAVYPRYETLYDGKLVDHVHNDYIEMLAETGLLGRDLRTCIPVDSVSSSPDLLRSRAGPFFSRPPCRCHGWFMRNIASYFRGLQLAHPLKQSAVPSDGSSCHYASSGDRSGG